ncbi:MAG: NusG domain II-containing protein [Enterococcus sp.]
MKFKNFVKKSSLKPWDIIIILFLILLSFLPLFIFGQQQKASTTSEKQAILRVDGKEIRSFDLIKGQKSYTYNYKDSDGDFNLIEVSSDKIRIKEADCGDQVCVRRGWASKNGDTIVCLPHKLVIEIKSLNGSDDDSLIY